MLEKLKKFTTKRRRETRQRGENPQAEDQGPALQREEEGAWSKTWGQPHQEGTRRKCPAEGCNRHTMTASQPHGEATHNGMQQNSNFYKFQEEPRRTSSPRSRRRKGKKVPKREQMMGEDGLSSLQTHLQEVAQPVQAHGQGQRMGERPTPPTTVQARSSTPRSCRSSRPEQKMRSRGRSKLKLSLKVMDYINHLNEQVKKETFTHKITMPSAVKENHHQRLFLSERQT